MSKQIIIFTDLDGTLLDQNTFNFDIINDYFKELISSGIIIIPNSSKTEAELLDFNRQYNLNLSFIAENGSSINRLNFLHRDLPNKVLIGKSIEQIYNIFNENIPSVFKQKIIFISKLKKKEQEKILGLPINKLPLAMNRMHSISIQFSGDEKEKNNLIKSVNDIGLSIQSGGRIMNICDNVDKSNAMSKTIELISSKIDNSLITIGVGDNQNDLEMLKKSDYPCLVKNESFDSSLINVDNLIKSKKPSPQGWADVIKTAIQKIQT